MPTPSPTVRSLSVALAMAVATVLPSTAAQAQTLCSEPVEPICATAIPATEPNAATDQAVARSRCMEDAETYREKLLEYQQCLEGSLSEARAGVAAAEEFIRCLADSKPDCRLRGAP